MKTFISVFVVTLALAFTIPAFAGDTDKQAQKQCQKDGNWELRPSPVRENIEVPSGGASPRRSSRLLAHAGRLLKELPEIELTRLDSLTQA